MPVGSTKKSPVSSVFSLERTVELECGRQIRIRRWSVSRAIAMSTMIASLAESLWKEVGNQQAAKYNAAVAEAQEKGIPENDEEFPNPDDFKTVSEREIVASIPLLLEVAQERVADFVHECTKVGKNGVPQCSVEQILGNTDNNPWTIDDFVDVLTTIIEMNITEKTVKKMKRLFQVGKAAMRSLSQTKSA